MAKASSNIGSLPTTQAKQLDRILVVDDHRLFLEGLRHLLLNLDEQLEIDMVGDVRSAIEHLDAGISYRLCIVDLSLPGLDGFAFLNAVSERKILTPCMVLSSSVKLSDIKRATDLGALGFVRKDVSSEEMLAAVHRVLRGEIVLPDEIWPLLDSYPQAQNKVANQAEAEPNESAAVGIGERQLKVLALVAEGLSNKDIAAVLEIKEATVKYHVGILFKSLNVSSRTALIKRAAEQGLV